MNSPKDCPELQNPDVSMAKLLRFAQTIGKLPDEYRFTVDLVHDAELRIENGEQPLAPAEFATGVAKDVIAAMVSLLDTDAGLTPEEAGEYTLKYLLMDVP